MTFRAFLLAVGLASAFTACGTSTSTTPAQGGSSTTSRQPELWPKQKSPFDAKKTAAIDQKVEALMAWMSLEQKVGQMVQAELGHVTPEDVRKYHLGSVLEGGGTYAYGNKYTSVAEWVALMDSYWQASMDISDGGLAIPIIWGTDALHGHNKIYGATIFPHNIGLGATRNGELVREIAEVTAKEVLVTGMDWTFAPAVSVVRDDRWGRAYEGFAEEPTLVAELGAKAVEGYQGSLADGTFMDGNRIIASAKHYLADGGTAHGVDRGDNADDEKTLVKIHAPGYFSTLDAGVLSVMASHSSWQGTRMHGEKYLLTDILKHRLGFDGFIVGDWNSHGLVDGCTNTSCPQAINAGLDMIMAPDSWKGFIKNTVAQVKAGEIPMARIDDAVRRILRAKFRAGIMDAPAPSARAWANQEEVLANPEHRALARQAVRESLVLLKNNGNVLPLNPTQRVLVAGQGANDIGQLAGGWTLSWQGTGAQNSDFPNGMSVYEGIREVVESAGGKVQLSEKGRYTRRPDVAIVVFGEQPYAEWQGDIKTIAYQHRDHEDAKLLEKLQQRGIKTVAVFISGRPRWVNRELNAADAFVAAWLPGTEGGGIADVLFTSPTGKIRYDFSGTLPFSWPRSAEQAELNVGDKPYDPLFAFGYGLSYTTGTTYLPQLDTHFDAATIDTGPQDIIVFNGRTQAPWSLVAKDPVMSLIYQGAMVENSTLSLTEADQDTQGDAVQARWNGTGPGLMAVRSLDGKVNLSHLESANAAVEFEVYPVEYATQPVLLQMTCGEQCKAEVDVTAKINASPREEWNRITVDFACFSNNGLKLDRVDQQFGLLTEGQLDMRVASIRFVPQMADKAGIRCQ